MYIIFNNKQNKNKFIMEKVFQTLREVMDFDFSELTPSKSNYLTINSLPVFKESQNFEKWRVVAKPQDNDQPRILLEITPKWLTITVHQGGNLSSRRINIPSHKKDPKSILKGIFELWFPYNGQNEFLIWPFYYYQLKNWIN